MSKLKITVGLGSIDEYIPYVKAGADEVFCGYMPEKWSNKFGINKPINRREVLNYNVQIGSSSELAILKEMTKEYRIPVVIAFNSIYYTKEQYPVLEEIIRECMELGFSSFIVADIGLIIHLNQKGLTKMCNIYVSGEMSEVNSFMVKMLAESGVKRIIFQRRNIPSDMKKIIKNNPKLEYEAFAMNELCHFHGAFCSSLHCDELCHMCHVPYKIGNVYDKRDENNDDKIDKEKRKDLDEEFDEEYVPGLTGCGLCALWDLRDANINYLKIVGRGNYIDDMLMDIKAMKQAIEILNKSLNKEEYKREMKAAIFKKGCGGRCYYKE